MGGWKFKLSGYPGAKWFLGSGVYSSGTSTFSGTLTCEPQFHSAVNCGSSGIRWCADEVCAYNWASPDIYGANPYGVSVVSVPVTNVTQAW